MRMMLRKIIVGSIFGIVLLAALPFSASAANLVSWQMVRQGTTDPVDTIYVGGNYQLQILIENDFRLGGLNLYLIIESPDGVIWEYQDSIVTVIPGCRMDGAWDMTGLLLTYFNIEGPSADSFLVGGVALMVGMDTGPLEPMFGFNLTPLNEEEWINGHIGTICLKFSRRGFWHGVNSVFVDMSGAASEPDVTLDRCWPVVMICGNPNGDDDINVGDPVFLINHIFRQGPGPNPFLLGDANLDGDVNVGDVIFLINSSFLTGPRPACPAEE